MKHCAVLLACTLVFHSAAARAADAPNTLSADELNDGWILLFDGATTFGWKAASDANWKVADSVISVDSGDPGLLATTTQFGDYVLKVDFRAPKATNSGVFLRTPAEPTNPAVDCYELNIAPPDNPFPTGSLVGRRATQKLPAAWDGAWHAFDITAVGGKFSINCDGNLILEYVDPTPLRRGHVGLQSKQGEVAFRNVRIHELRDK